MLFLFVVLIAATGAHVALGTLVLHRIPRSETGRRFALVAFSVGLWVACTAAVMSPWGTQATVLWTARATFAAATLIGIAWLWFCMGFPQPSEHFRRVRAMIMTLFARRHRRST